MTERQQSVNLGDEDALGSLSADVFELAGRLRGMADLIARHEGQTRTRWYVMSVFSGVPLTVAQAARRLGTSRQAVQRTTDDLVDAGLITLVLNPDHRSSPFAQLTLDGRDVLGRITARAAAERRNRLRHLSDDTVREVHEAVRALLVALSPL